MKIGDKVRILDNAFGDSIDPDDIAARGKVGEVACDLEDELGPDFTGCWVVTVDGKDKHLTVDEVELVKGEE